MTAPDNPTSSSSSLSSSSLAQLEETLRCPLCRNTLNRPLLSSTCSHVFCENCINDAIESGVDVYVPKKKDKKRRQQQQLLIFSQHPSAAAAAAPTPTATAASSTSVNTSIGFHIRPPDEAISDFKRQRVQFSCPVCLMPAFKWMLRPVPALAGFLCALEAAREKFAKISNDSSNNNNVSISIIDKDNGDDCGKGSADVPLTTTREEEDDNNTNNNTSFSYPKSFSAPPPPPLPSVRSFCTASTCASSSSSSFGFPGSNGASTIAQMSTAPALSSIPQQQQPTTATATTPLVMSANTAVVSFGGGEGAETCSFSSPQALSSVKRCDDVTTPIASTFTTNTNTNTNTTASSSLSAAAMRTPTARTAATAAGAAATTTADFSSKRAREEDYEDTDAKEDEERDLIPVLFSSSSAASASASASVVKKPAILASTPAAPTMIELAASVATTADTPSEQQTQDIQLWGRPTLLLHTKTVSSSSPNRNHHHHHHIQQQNDCVTPLIANCVTTNNADSNTVATLSTCDESDFSGAASRRLLPAIASHDLGGERGQQEEEGGGTQLGQREPSSPVQCTADDDKEGDDNQKGKEEQEKKWCGGRAVGGGSESVTATTTERTVVHSVAASAPMSAIATTAAKHGDSSTAVAGAAAAMTTERGSVCGGGGGFVILCDTSLSPSQHTFVRDACAQLSGARVIESDSDSDSNCTTSEKQQGAANDPVRCDLFSASQHRRRRHQDEENTDTATNHRPSPLAAAVGISSSACVTTTITHVVCNLQKPSHHLATLSVRACAAATQRSPVWVVDVSWVQRSVTSRRWAPEAPFECAGLPSLHGCFGAARSVAAQRAHMLIEQNRTSTSTTTPTPTTSKDRYNPLPWVKNAAFCFTASAISEARGGGRGGVSVLRRLVEPCGGRLLGDVVAEYAQTATSRKRNSMCVLPMSVFLVFSTAEGSITSELRRIGCYSDKTGSTASSSSSSPREKKRTLERICATQLGLLGPQQQQQQRHEDEDHGSLVSALASLFALVGADAVCCRSLDTFLLRMVTMSQVP